MFENLETLNFHYDEIVNELGSPRVSEDVPRYLALMKEQAEIAPIVSAYREYRKVSSELTELSTLLSDEKSEEMRDLLKSEIAEGKKKAEKLSVSLRLMLLPKDPNDEKNIVLEIRSGAGGEEAGLFAAELYRMYLRFAETKGFKAETLEYNESGIGGVSKVTALIAGKGAYSLFKYESGVHRVQRVPKTESGGRIHTSTATVAIMPEAEEVDVRVDLNDCKFDVFRASGNGGQCVNTTDSAVRLTHLPTGIVVSCQDEKSQLKNKDKSLRVLRAKLYELELEKKQAEDRSLRLTQIGTGDRSEKIRTYNFPQGRVTDHRIGLTLYRINEIMDGDLTELLNALIEADRAAKLSGTEGTESGQSSASFSHLE